MTPRNRVFLDTSYAIALVISGDQYHSQALTLADRLEELPISMVTTRGVMLEIGDALSRQRFRQQAVTLLNYLESEPSVEIVQITESLYQRALRLFQDRPDKDWGLTDCLSFIVMQDYGLTDALTSDNHFRQAGFRALLLEDAL